MGAVMAAPPYFAFYPKDFIADVLVESMDTLQVGAYIRLICAAWQHEPPASLPNDDAILGRIARLDSVAWTAVKAGVLAPFTIGRDGRLHQKRLREEYEKCARALSGKSAGGKKGARTRWGAKGRKPPAEAPLPAPNGIPNGIPINNPMGAGSDSRSPSGKKGKGVKGGTFPPPLDTPAFRAAWDSWVSYRREKRSTLTPQTVRKQLAVLASHGLDAALWAVDKSIERGWLGLFPENYKPPAGGRAADAIDPVEEKRKLDAEEFG
jgi:uncharacterized protein YdaU (DUF1376 family)